MQDAKAQAASLDIVIAVSAILLFIALVVAFFPTKPQSASIYNSKAFVGIENAQPAFAFLKGYAVDEAKLLAFAGLGENAMESIVLNSTEFSGFTSDICIFFADKAGIMPIGAANTIGNVFLDSSKTTKGACSTSSPCAHYDKTSIYTRPVARPHKLVNMHVVVCR